MHRVILCRVLTAEGGVCLFTEGDSVFAAFSDATAALRACVLGQLALVEHAWPDPEVRPRVRMGLHTGYAEPVSGEYATHEVHRAARVAAAAHGGQVLCSGATASRAATAESGSDGFDLLDLGLYQLRGFDGRERLFQLAAEGLGRSFPRPRTLAATAHNLPAAASSFVGRHIETAHVRALVAAHRLVTIVGPGGAGKTRLALEAASAVVGGFGDGVWFIDLAAVSDAELVAVSVAEVMGVRPEPGRPIMETLAEYVGMRQVLVVLDTCDAHLPAVGAVAHRLLAAGENVRILATSREPLVTPGELVWRIPPLRLIAERPDAPAEAVELLIDRAATARGGVLASPDELAALDRVAQRLDGLPLALELAAARLRLFSPAQLADRLDDLFGTLDAGGNPTGEPGSGTTAGGPATAHRYRHRTLAATVDWSYRTLPPSAATLLRRLSVFAGPFDLATVEWVADTPALDNLALLVDKSMLAAEPSFAPHEGYAPRGDGELTYRILDPIRAFAVRALAQADEERAARDRHLAWALRELELVQLDASGKPGTLSTYPLDRLAVEVRASLHWSVTTGRVRDGLRLAVELDEWWRERGLARECRLWFFRLFEKLAAGPADTGMDEIPAAELANAYRVYAHHAGIDGEYGEQLRLLVQAEEAAWRSGQPALIARVSAGRGDALVALGREDEAERSCRDVIDWAAARHVGGEALPAVLCLAQLRWQRGALAEAANELAAARAVAANHPTERGRRSIDMLLGLVALSRGDLVAAHDHIVVALRFRMTYGYHWGACEALTAMAVRCALGGELAQAATLFGAAQAARARFRSAHPAIGAMGRRHESAVRNTMGDTAFDTAYGVGAAMSLAEATRFALAVEHPDLQHALVRLSVDTDPTADLRLEPLRRTTAS
jgi:predicted ATPase